MSARLAPRLAVLALVLAVWVSAPRPADSAETVKKPSPNAQSDNATASEAYIEDLEGAKVNWAEGRLSVSGIGTPGDRGPVNYRRKLAERSAIADAFRRLATTLELVRVDTNTRLKDLAINDDALRVRLNDYIKGAKVLETNYWPDGTAEVVLSVSLRGDRSLTALAAGQSTKPIGSPEPMASPTPTPKPSAGKEIVTSPVPLHAGYSSVIVDAHGLGAQAALLPNLRDNAGKVIDFGLAGAKSVIKYVKEGAELDAAAGLNPIVVRSVKTQGALKADFVLSPDASETLKQALKDKKLPKGTPVLIRL